MTAAVGSEVSCTSYVRGGPATTTSAVVSLTRTPAVSSSVIVKVIGVSTIGFAVMPEAVAFITSVSLPSAIRSSAMLTVAVASVAPRAMVKLAGSV